MGDWNETKWNKISDQSTKKIETNCMRYLAYKSRCFQDYSQTIGFKFSFLEEYQKQEYYSIIIL